MNKTKIEESEYEKSLRDEINRLVLIKRKIGRMQAFDSCNEIFTIKEYEMLFQAVRFRIDHYETNLAMRQANNERRRQNEQNKN